LIDNHQNQQYFTRVNLPRSLFDQSRSTVIMFSSAGATRSHGHEHKLSTSVPKTA